MEINMREPIKLWQTLIISLVCSAFTGLLGWSISQGRLANIVAVDSQRIGRIEGDIEKLAGASNAHMKDALDLFRREIDSRTSTDKDFIQAIKTQNEILITLIGKTKTPN